MNIIRNEMLLKVFKILYCILILAAFAALLYGIVAVDDVSFKISGVVEIVILALGGAYLVEGFKKDGAKFYKAFMIACAISFIVEYLCYSFWFGTSTDLGASSLETVFNLICFGCVLTLGVGKDIGKKVSFSLCAVYLAVTIASLVLAIVVEIPEGTEMIGYLLRTIVWVFTGTLISIMTVAKYADKAIRNTK